mgnify:FL=1|tara:strand:- start:175 stop:417 length:243 start_codon:yes stop_codon:yes gene_type:complete
MNTQSIENQTQLLTLAASQSVFLTAKEMIAAGLSKEWAVEELSAMYSSYGLPEDWFITVIEGVLEVLNLTKTCNTHSGSV